MKTLGGQGYGTGSSWSRGQAWAIYGFALSYLHTKDEKYLDTSRRAAHYFLANIEQSNYYSLVDFRAPKIPGNLIRPLQPLQLVGYLKLANTFLN